MARFIRTVVVDLLDSKLKTSIEFGEGINLLSGINGSGKSRLLEHIRANASNPSIVRQNDGQPYDQSRIAYVNPKRFSIKKQAVGLLEQLARQGKDRKILQNQLRQQFNDDNSLEMPSFEETLVTSVGRLTGTGKINGDQATKDVIAEFNEQLNAIFPGYKIRGSWSSNEGSKGPEFRIIKNGIELTPLELSTGEKEILALAFAIYTAEEEFDLFLIDEPEIHLNWSLETNLFNFLKQFANKYSKQLIIATHSSIVFDEGFLEHTLFFQWENGNVKVSKVPSPSLQALLAKTTLQRVINLDSATRTFFVEDEMQALVINTLSNQLGVVVNIEILEGSGNVLKTARILGSKLNNARFVLDGDNKPDKNILNLIHLHGYCIENYLVDAKAMSVMTSKTQLEMYEQIRASVASLSTRLPKDPHVVLASLEKQVSIQNFSQILNTFDMSNIFKGSDALHKKVGYASKKQFVEKYIETLNVSGRLEVVFGELTNEIK